MRCLSLLVIAILALPVLAQDPAKQPPAASAEKQALPGDISKFHLRERKSQSAEFRAAENIGLEPAADCYMLRTYFVEREDAESDVTRVVGSTTCQPSSRFTLKSAVSTVR